ncbi:hypothetical protein SAMN06269117_10716 [Balnearium lithotrophicum]|uniref:Uncharacterized protein n=2 Tax=Balnearium lithotrophicum TaxID=223788 RepID=A0A521BRA9_9BACT|nr:hypothetical protein SAMN06269117_10716 [Balnearium lithotrophicum]
MLGLFFVDNKGSSWINEMNEVLYGQECKGKPVVFFWWHQKPKGTDKTLTYLQNELKKFGFFPIYAKTQDGCYMFTAVDFIVNPLENFEKIKSSWGKKYCLYKWSSQDEIKKDIESEIEEKQKKDKTGITSIPKVLFVISCVIEIDCSKQVFHQENIRANLIPIEL